MFAKLSALALALALIGCVGPGPLREPQPKRAAGLTTQRIAHNGSDQFLNARDPRFAPWRRPEDDFRTGPIHVAISKIGYACIVPASVWAVLREGLEVTCEWRAPRRGWSDWRGSE